MRPDERDLDDEIRGHLAISVKERIERGEDPEASRLAALREFGNVTLTRDSMRGVWRPRWFDAAEGLAAAVASRPAAMGRTRIRGTGRVLALPVVVDLLPAALQLLEGGSMRLLPVAVLLGGAVVGLQPRLLGLPRRALQGAWQ